MITVNRLNGQTILINPHLIETIEATPDTIITLTTGKKYVVSDSVDNVYRKLFNIDGKSNVSLRKMATNKTAGRD